MRTEELGVSPVQIGGMREKLLFWLPVMLGVAILYVPSLVTLLTGIWGTPEQGHGPIILMLACWLAYRKWNGMIAACEGTVPTGLGYVPLILGLLAYILGRSQDIAVLEVGSAILVLSGILLLLLGPAALKAQWFPLFFMLFMIPLPGPLVDMLTLPMKVAVSFVAENVLFGLGYPIARTGVILQIGNYQLLVADACAGLHTLFTLEALGLLYLNVVKHDSAFRNILLTLLIVPISFTANVIRVMVLTLITYYLGDAAGQGFLHGFAGMVLFVSALLLIVGVDSLLRFIEPLERRKQLQAKQGGVA